jgi:hypothetical protein
LREEESSVMRMDGMEFLGGRCVWIALALKHNVRKISWASHDTTKKEPFFRPIPFQAIRQRLSLHEPPVNEQKLPYDIDPQHPPIPSSIKFRIVAAPEPAFTILSASGFTVLVK